MDINSRKHCRLYRNQNPHLPLPFPEVNPSDALLEKWAGNEKNRPELCSISELYFHALVCYNQERESKVVV